MGRARKNLPKAVEGQPLRSADALLWGITRSRQRRADISHPHRGVARIPSDEPDDLGAVASYEAIRLPGQFYSHATAARAHGIPMPGDAARSLHVSVEAPRTAPKRPGVSGHSVRLARELTADEAGRPVTSPEDTWIQLASTLTAYDLVAAGDYLISERRRETATLPALTTVERLADTANFYRSVRGAKKIAWALPRLRTGVASRPETHLRLILVDAGLPEPLVADPTPVERGLVLHPDLKYRHARLLLEYEGDGHRTDDRQWRSDITRREMFEAAGWRVMRVTSSDIYRDRVNFVRRVHRVTASRIAS